VRIWSLDTNEQETYCIVRCIASEHGEPLVTMHVQEWQGDLDRIVLAKFANALDVRRYPHTKLYVRVLLRLIDGSETRKFMSK